MRILDEFHIDIFKLKPGVYQYDYTIGDAFFAEFDQDLVNQGALSVALKLDKQDTFIELNFDIKGQVQLTCDRSLDTFMHPVAIQEHLILKYGDEAETVSEEFEIIPANAMAINVAEYIYEFVAVSIPLKRLHPRFDPDEEGEDLVYSTGEQAPQEDETPDPRWEALKNLKKEQK
jgi:uncharacterized metal-binding protein YceD (DUF177 family)